MTRRTITFNCTALHSVGYSHNQQVVTAEGVDVTDFIDAEMAVEELNRDDLLNQMDAADVADWLRGEGYHVEEE